LSCGACPSGAVWGVLSATQQPTWCHDLDTTPAGGGRAHSEAFIKNDEYDRSPKGYEYGSGTVYAL